MIPHPAIPPRLRPDGGLVEVEQDSPDEIYQCVTAVLLTPAGSRMDLPDMGLTDPLWTDMDSQADVERIRAQLDPRGGYETRLEVLATERPDLVDQALKLINVRTNGG